MKKGIMDIKLVDGLIISECKSKWDANDSGFNDMTVDINAVYARGMMVSLSNSASFVAIKTAIGFLFCSRNPFVLDSDGSGWWRNKSSCINSMKGIKLIKHSLSLV